MSPERWSLGLVVWAAASTVGAARALALPRLPGPAGAVGRPVAWPVRRGSRRRPARGAGAGLAEVVESLAAAVAAGRPLAEGLAEAVVGAAAPVRAELSHLAARLARGAPLVATFDRWAETSPLTGAPLVAAAVGVAGEAGGDLAGSLAGAAGTLRERRAVDREVRALSAQARASATVLAVAPVGVLAVTAGLDSGATAFLVGGPAGWACLGLGAALDTAGWLWMRRIAVRVGEPSGRADPTATLPDTADLLAVAAHAGLPVAGSLAAVAPRCPEPWRRALVGCHAAASGGSLLADALRGVPEVAGAGAEPLVAVLRAALADGDGLTDGLHRLAADGRDLRRRAAEERARRLPVRMLLPLVCCSLPAFVLVALVPLLAGALAGLRPPG